MESVLNAILSMLHKIYDFLVGNKRPKITQGGLVKLASGKQESVEIEVPDEWADDWTIYVTPSDNYYSIVQGKTASRIRVKVEIGTGKSVTRHNDSPRTYNGTAYSNPALDSDKWLDCAVVGEAFHISGKSATVSVRNIAGINDGQFFDVEVSASKGRPKNREVAQHRVQLSNGGATGVAIPRFSKRVKFMTVGSIVSPSETIDDMPDTAFLDMVLGTTMAIEQLDWPLMAAQITADGAGNVIMCSKDSRWINLPCNATAIRFSAITVGDIMEVIPVWEVVE